MERRFLTNADKIEKFENNLLTVTLADGGVLSPLEARCLFPISMPTQYITLLDEDGQEACVIRALSDMDQEAQAVLSASLSDYYLVPRILRIVSKSDRYGVLRWRVETDRGEKSFDIRNRNYDIRVSPDGSVRVRDADDNRYLIEDYRALDAHSQKILLPDL